MPNAKRPVLLIAEPDRFAATDLLQDLFTIRKGPFTRKQLQRAVAEADVLWVRLGHRIDRILLNAAPRLRSIVSPTTGLNHIDRDACAEHRVRIFCLRGENTFLRTVTATAEHALGLALALLRQTVPAHRAVCVGVWDRDRFIGRQASGLTLGIVGMGRLGRIICRLARPIFGRILGTDPAPAAFPPGIQRVPLRHLLSTADVVTLHLHSSPETRHLLNAAAFRAMKPGAYLVNTSRGDVIDEKALLTALRSGRLAGAALDVLTDEHASRFNPRTHPLVRYAKTHPNLVLTPHIGGATEESLPAAERFMAEKLRRHMMRWS